MPPAHRGPTGSPMDRWTDASPSAIASGFHAAMSIGPQPKLRPGQPTTLAHTLSTSGDLHTDDDDDEDEEDDDDGSPAGATSKKGNGKSSSGKKAGPKSKEAKAAQHRKEQNRAAQREFRQRKQQYIRALEARVELLSSDHDAQVDRLRYALRLLLAENNSLRNMVGSLAQFIGKRNIGGVLAESGMSRTELEEAIGSSSEKTMAEAWANWPGAGECEALKEIRKESNIPLDGLPESKLPAQLREANQNKGGSSHESDLSGKRKSQDAVAAADTSKGAKRKRQTDDVKPSAAGQDDSATPSTSQNDGSRPGTGTISKSAAPNTYGQPITASPQTVGATESAQTWQNPSQTPSQSALLWPQQAQAQQLRNDVDSVFMQTLLAGSTPTNAASLDAFMQYGAAMTPTGMGQDLYDSAGIGFNPILLGNDTNNTNNFSSVTSSNNNDFLNASGATAGLLMGGNYFPGNSVPTRSSVPDQRQSFQASASNPATPTAPENDLQTSTPGRTTKAMTAEAVMMLRKRIGRIIASVNRIWSKKGATSFITLPPDVHLDENDMKQVQEAESTYPELKLASIQMPNGWDEGDLSSPAGAEDSGGNRRHPRDVERIIEGFTQLSYHLTNHHFNPSYRLPPLLKPTAIQQSTSHDIIIDGIPWASVRDKLVQNPQLNCHVVMVDLLRFGEVLNGDLTSERNWVLGHNFFIRYPELIDEDVLANTNRLRSSRGQEPLTMAQIWEDHRKYKQFSEAKLKELM